MATKQFMTLNNLTLYDQLIKAKMATDISEAEARSLHTVVLDGTTLKFYREEEPVGSATPAYSISLPQQDLSNYLQKITSATGGKVVASVNDGTIEESAIDVSDLVVSSDLADVATSGEAGDVTYDNTESGLTATDVQSAIDELAEQSSGGVASKTVYITETSGASGDPYSKRYGIYQGDQGSASSPVVAEKLADIDIPKDMVVEDGAVVDVVFKASDNTLHEGSESGTDVTAEIMGSATPTASDAGKYIKLTIANASSSHLWIKATDLVDIYTTEQNATQVQLSIDNNNVISAVLVDGGVATAKLADGAVTAVKLATDSVTTAKIVDANVTADKLASNAVTTAKIADDAVTADKVAISAHTESQTAGADGVAISVTTTDGQVSAVSASIASNTYDAYGSASAVETALIGSSTDTGSANTIYGAKAYADASTEAIAEADIRALFSSPSA